MFWKNKVVAKRGHSGEWKHGDFNKGLQKYYHAEYEHVANPFFMKGSNFLSVAEKTNIARKPSADYKLINSKSLLNNLGNTF